jgi:DNA-binding transcriptional MerR regulator
MVRPPKVEHLKPEKFRDHFTISEVAWAVGRDVSRIRQLEREGRIPKPVRHRVGELQVRLYSPAAVDEIQDIIGHMKPGRPRKT